MKVAIIGTGYVGLATAIALAEKGHSVTCVDVRQDIVAAINAKQCPLHEPALPAALRNVSLHATTNLPKAVQESALSLLCVGTPTQQHATAADLSYLEAAARQIGFALRDQKSYHVIVVKSTVPPGTTDSRVKNIIEDASGRCLGEADTHLGLAMVPEFLREGAALADSRHPGRFIFGVETKRSAKILTELFEDFSVPIVVTNSRTAEFCKYMTNALLATLISFGNDLANLGLSLGHIEFGHALEALGHDPRFWPGEAGKKPGILDYLVPGCGFGGSCFPKDLRALLSVAEDIHYDLTLPKAALALNNQQAQHSLKRLAAFFHHDLHGKRFSIYGLAFKPHTDDVRESPAARFIDALLEHNCHIRAYDPVAEDNYRASFSHSTKVQFVHAARELFAQSDGVIIVTPWPQELAVFYEAHALATMRHRLIWDARGALDHTKMHRLPCRYFSPLIAWRTDNVPYSA